MPMKIAMTTPNSETAVRPRLIDHQALDVDGNLAHENGRARKQQGERDQVVEHAVADRFAKCVARDVNDARAHTAVPRVFPAVCGCECLQLLHKISFQRSAQRSNRDQPDALAAQRVNGGVLLILRKHRANRVSGDVAFRAQGLHRRRNLRALPDHFHFALNCRRSNLPPRPRRAIRLC